MKAGHPLSRSECQAPLDALPPCQPPSLGLRRWKNGALDREPAGRPRGGHLHGTPGGGAGGLLPCPAP
ncbi:hypothetical protein CSW26_08175 [Thermus scotoductus]|nr:hypothetical protein CSW26_08175 [Thermus scotoductus]